MRILELGRGPAVVFLHGAPSPSTDFLPIAQALAPTHRSLIVDLPGYRGEPALEKRDAFARTQAMLEDELLARGIREAAVVGFSAGALRAFSLAFSSRVHINAVVSLGGFAGLDAAERQAHRPTLDALRAGQLTGKALPPLFLSPAYLAGHAQEAHQIEGWMDLIDALSLADEFESITQIAPDFRPRLRELSIPVFAAAGELDLAINPAHTRALPTYYPKAEIDIVPGAGHSLLYECPDRVLAGIRRTMQAAGDPARPWAD
jgi:3-oxoadipate enol-lactonase